MGKPRQVNQEYQTRNSYKLRNKGRRKKGRLKKLPRLQRKKRQPGLQQQKKKKLPPRKTREGRELEVLMLMQTMHPKSTPGKP